MSKSQATPSRRGFVLGAATAGAITAAAVVMKTAPDAATPVAETPPKPERGGGYRLSAHVQQYYKTTRL